MTAGHGEARAPAKAWFPYWKPKPEARLRLFCFPFAGGSASVFHRRADFGPTVEVLVAQYPGREGRFAEPPFRRVTTLVEALAPVMLPLLDRPFAFFGYSLGTLVAFELARWLRRSGAPAPRGLLQAAGRPPTLLRKRGVHELPTEEFIEVLRRYGGTPPAVLAHRELLELLIPMLRADMEMVETYTAAEEPPLSMPIIALGGEEDAEPTPQELEGWREFTSRDFKVQLLPGGHFFLLSAGESLSDVVEPTLQHWASAGS
ncbi:MAG: thioesterase [Myxococcaceae bacterium]|nr:thioesterase [Myxococcaceae bacterium]